VIENLDGVETIAKGDSFAIAGADFRYACTEDVALVAGSATVKISPPLRKAYTSGDVVTFETKATAHADAYDPNFLFHRDYAVLVMAELPDNKTPSHQKLGVDIFTAFDPISGLAIRARRYYDNGAPGVVITLDALFAMKTINPNYGVVVRQNSA